MVLDLLKPVSLLLSILSLLGVFHAAFLVPASTFEDRMLNGLLLLVVAAAISAVAGLLFREAEIEAEARFDAEFKAWFGAHTPPTPAPALGDTLPVQVFCWSAAIMLILFAVSWYIETYCILYRDLRP